MCWRKATPQLYHLPTPQLSLAVPGATPASNLLCHVRCLCVTAWLWKAQGGCFVASISISCAVKRGRCLCLSSILQREKKHSRAASTDTLHSHPHAQVCHYTSDQLVKLAFCDMMEGNTARDITLFCSITPPTHTSSIQTQPPALSKEEKMCSQTHNLISCGGRGQLSL